jgi:hypothetical protein
MFILMILYGVCVLAAQFCSQSFTCGRSKALYKSRKFYTLENFRWCGESYSSGAAILRGRFIELKIKVKVILRATVGRPVCLGVRHPSGTSDQFVSFFKIIFRQLRVVDVGPLSEERPGL